MSAGSSIHAVFFCAFRHFAQRAFWYAAMRLRAAADILRPLRASIATTFCPLTFAEPLLRRTPDGAYEPGSFRQTGQEEVAD
jgi:hypothetical protein